MFDTLAVAQQLAAGGVEGRGVNPGDPGSSPPARPCAAPLNEGRGEPAPTRGPWKNGPGPPNLVEELQRWLTTTGGGEVMDQPPSRRCDERRPRRTVGLPVFGGVFGG